MEKSNVLFNKFPQTPISTNMLNLNLNDEQVEIGVNEEYRYLICIGNSGKHLTKVQFSFKNSSDRYDIRTEPVIATLGSGKACEFEIFIKPLCTCSINDIIKVVAIEIKNNKEYYGNITIQFETLLSTHLDYDELIEDTILGEGSFGIVYKGIFRGNQVAIKKMKQLNSNDSMEEFHKEVSMLDKFRNDYIVHFYGAVFIPNKICMVTEFAQYGSLHNLIDNRKGNPIDNTMKMKILLDCSKGIEYLHSNGILHRDIKPDNFLVLSLDTINKVNAKLTDFGSSRNINMMMTNISFTKGVGTPKYMAPEILNKKKYKKAADIYSFAITIYETMIWGEAYEGNKFKYPWDIATFVSKGDRLPKLDDINDKVFELIENCWCQEPSSRLVTTSVVNNLELLN